MVRAPVYLFHWTTKNKLKHFARHAQNSGQLLLKPLPRAAALYRFHPELRPKRALFAWSHPVTGIASGPRVVYAAENAADSRLIALRIKNDARVSRVQDHDGRRRRAPTAVPTRAGADLIYHEITYDGSLVREWVILNPACVASFTADAGFLRRFLKREIRLLSDARYDYSPAQAHALKKLPRISRTAFLSVTSPGLRDKIVVPALKAVARIRPWRIPPALRAPFPAFGRGRAHQGAARA
ncbi:MAG TPA: hypothetical protein VNK24_09695 [Elusimicrobiota bacterium]|nr:hypothetical protein [Elusimicrobiota bacterium]